jgi:PAS domain S-box-containing protein
MATRSWNDEQMRRLRTSVLERGVRRFRRALQHLADRHTAPVNRLRRGLRAMEGELARRGQQDAAQQAAARAGRGDGAPVGESASPAPPGDGEEGATHAPPPEDREPSASEPIWRLIPYLSGTSSKVVSVLDEEGVVRYQSAPIKWLLGYDAEELIGEPLRAFLQAGSQSRAEEAVARMARAEEKFECWRLLFSTASGGALWLEGMASNFLRDARLGGILVYWRELVG